MKITRIELYQTAMPLISPWRTAYGDDAEIHSVFCRLCSGDLDAWSESNAFQAPCYSPEWADSIFTLARDWLAPRVIGRTFPTSADVQASFSQFKGNPFAKALFDIAWWGLESRRQGIPLHRLLGATRDVIPVGADFGVLDTVDELLGCMREVVSLGFPRIKLKYRPGWDFPMLSAVRREFPEVPIHIDCNGGYSLDDLPMFEEIDQLSLEMIEQPLASDDLVDHAELQRRIRTPICLDESVVSLRHARQAIELGSCRYVNIKPGRVGGLTPAVQIHDLCREHGIPCWVGGMLESAVGVSHCIALAMLDNCTYPADLFASSKYYHEDVGLKPIEFASGLHVPSMTAPEELIDPHPDRLRACTIRQHTLTC